MAPHAIITGFSAFFARIRTNRQVLVFLLAVLPLSPAMKAQVLLENAFPDIRFNRPVDIQNAGDDSNRLFVVEQAGRIFVFPNDAGVEETHVFLNIRSRVNAGGNEEGLLGLAFHPDYANNGSLFVNYTASNPRRTVISRFAVSADPNIANPASEVEILTFKQPFSNHNGGQLAFGPDGFLYICAGDGGSGGDPQNNGQNLTSMLGKMLRIDVDQPSDGLSYGIPADNPFIGNGDGFREEIFAYGLRNPWRFSFDPVTGMLWAGDVGQNRYEEIDVIENGGNYGWRIMEGNACYNPSSGCDRNGLTLPVIDYGRTDGKSVTSGHVYRGAGVPELKGAYVYADFVSGNIWSLRDEGSSGVVNDLLLASGQNIASFGVDEESELYICAFDGFIYRFKASTSEVTEPQGTPQPGTLELHSVYPNPAPAQGSETIISFTSSKSQQIMVRIHDSSGRMLRRLADKRFQPGTVSLRADFSGLPSGRYFLSIENNSKRITRPLQISR